MLMLPIGGSSQRFFRESLVGAPGLCAAVERKSQAAEPGTTPTPNPQQPSPLPAPLPAMIMGISRV
jgi:hypothetical protein